MLFNTAIDRETISTVGHFSLSHLRYRRPSAKIVYRPSHVQCLARRRAWARRRANDRKDQCSPRNAGRMTQIRRGPRETDAACLLWGLRDGAFGFRPHRAEHACTTSIFPIDTSFADSLHPRHRLFPGRLRVIRPSAAGAEALDLGAVLCRPLCGAGRAWLADWVVAVSLNQVESNPREKG